MKKTMMILIMLLFAFFLGRFSIDKSNTFENGNKEMQIDEIKKLYNGEIILLQNEIDTLIKHRLLKRGSTDNIDYTTREDYKPPKLVNEEPFVFSIDSLKNYEFTLLFYLTIDNKGNVLTVLHDFILPYGHAISIEPKERLQLYEKFLEYHSRKFQDCLYKWKFIPAKVSNYNVYSEIFLRVDVNKIRNPYINDNYLYRAYNGDNLVQIIQ